MWSALKIAFSMYSKIPMPNTEWTEKNMKYALCFFPMVGVPIAVLIWIWSIFAQRFQISDIFRTAVYVLIPIIVTGGIHIDGFVDTMDAINSYQPIERKLEILKDSHIGAFALIGGISYFILDFGVWSEVSGKGVIILGIGYVLSRALSGAGIVTFRCAKTSGLAAGFSEAAQKNKVRITMIIYVIACVLAMLLVDKVLGTASVIVAFGTFIYYRIMSYKKFGGITGDLAGFFLQICELGMALSIVLVEKLIMYL